MVKIGNGFITADLLYKNDRSLLINFILGYHKRMSEIEEITNFLECLADAIILVNESSEIIFANAACLKLFDYQAQAMQGMVIENLMGDPNKINHSEMVRKFIQSNSPARSMMTRDVLECIDGSGNIFNARISIASVNIDNRLYGVATIQDFTSLQREIEHLEISSYQDALTGLYNRRYLQKTADSKSRILSTWKSIGVMYMDLNNFKLINDKYGHQVGDAVLKVVSNRMNRCIRFDDIAFRLGGDEFLILLNLTNATNRTEILNNIAEKIYSEVTRTIAIKQTNIKVGFSAGCGIYPEDDTDLMRLVNKVDKVMYSAKETKTYIANV